MGQPDLRHFLPESTLPKPTDCTSFHQSFLFSPRFDPEFANGHSTSLVPVENGGKWVGGKWVGGKWVSLICAIFFRNLPCRNQQIARPSIKPFLFSPRVTPEFPTAFSILQKFISPADSAAYNKLSTYIERFLPSPCYVLAGLRRGALLSRAIPFSGANTMTPRSIRRAQEHKARKELARKARKEIDHKAEALSTPQPVEPAATETTSTEPAFLRSLRQLPRAKLIANRANSQLSTGPTTAEGKAKACLNAVKTALTGRTVLLPADDAAAYEQHVLAYTKELRPITQRECDLVQSIADTAWRLKRIPALEMAIYAQGRIEFAPSFDDHDPSLRPSMIELRTFLTYEKQLRNLQLQEARLARRYEKDTAELRKMQVERDQREAIDFDVASKLYLAAKHDNKPFDPGDHGFEFSMDDIESYLEGVRAAHITRPTLSKDREAAIRTAKTHSQAA